MKLEFVVEPASATITLDGKPVRGDVTEPKDAAEHELTVTAKGFVTHTETLHFDDNQRVSISLAKVSRPVGAHKPAGGHHERIETDSPYQ